MDREASRPAIQEKVFVLSEDVLQALPPLGIPAPAPQPPAPSPPKEKVPEIKPPLKQKQASPPKSRIELEAADLSEIGDLAIARENIQDKEAEAVVARPTPTRPSAPVFLEGQPGILKGIPPEYPPRALERGLEGTVVAQVTIDTNGQVTEARIARSAGRDFDESVLDAVRRLRFQP
ncbi:MAG TPA: TonB family protein, partial [Geothrix sp.]|nr:TonB family protein [Geothrix sp.]